MFCKNHHDSKACYRAERMTWMERMDTLKKKSCCFQCLKQGHISHFCKSNNKCVIWGKWHIHLMYPELPLSQNVNKSPEGKREQKEANMSNQNYIWEPVLHTLMAELIGDNWCEQKVRALINSGSQQSYVWKETVIDLGYQSVGSETISHVMFRGAISREQNHSLYKMKVHSLDGKSVCEIPVSNQAVIFGNIQRLKRRPWDGQLKGKKIWLSDNGQGCPNKWILTGEDICGLLFTGQ